MAPARNVSDAATTTEYFDCCSMCATFASVVVFPVPLIPTNRIRNGSPDAFFLLIISKRSTRPAESKSDDMLEIRLDFMASVILDFSTLEPIRSFFRSAFIESITSLATSDSRRAISSSNSTSSMSFSFSSFSPRLFATPANAPRSLSNMPSLAVCGLYDLVKLHPVLLYVLCQACLLGARVLDCHVDLPYAVLQIVQHVLGILLDCDP